MLGSILLGRKEGREVRDTLVHIIGGRAGTGSGVVEVANDASDRAVEHWLRVEATT